VVFLNFALLPEFFLFELQKLIQCRFMRWNNYFGQNASFSEFLFPVIAVAEDGAGNESDCPITIRMISSQLRGNFKDFNIPYIELSINLKGRDKNGYGFVARNLRVVSFTDV